MPTTNWKNYLVKIIVPAIDGGVYIATGYPFRENYILTAFHAIDKPDIDHDSKWQFIWEHYKDSEGQSERCEVQDPVIIGSDSGLDWSVIQVDFDAKLHNPVCFCPHSPRAHILLESEGFPAIRHENPEGIDHIGYQGNAHSKADSEDYFQINTVSGYTNPEDAGGMSGSPVFNSHGQCVALFAMIPDGLDGKAVWVLSTESILKDKNFSCLLTPEQKSPRYAAIKNILESKPCNQQQLREFLYCVFDINDRNIENLATKIDSADLECLSIIFDAVASELYQQSNCSLDVIIDFCHCLIPHLFTPHDRKSITDLLKRNTNDTWCIDFASTHEGAESQLASYDQRRTYFKSAELKEKSIDELRGEFAIDIPEAAGGEINPQTKLTQTESSFYLQFADSVTCNLQFDRLENGTLEERKDALEALRLSASNHLKKLNQMKKTRYHVQANPVDDEIIEKLARQCPYFLLIKLSRDQAMVNLENNIFLNLRALHQLNND